MKNGIRASWLVLIATLSTGCTTTYREALQERDAQIHGLEGERARLQAEVRDLSRQNAALETALADRRRSEAPTQPVSMQEPSFAELDSLGITTSERAGNLVITVPAQITFAAGQAELTDSGRKALATVADVLRRNYPDATYWIEGHTDSDPIQKSPFPTNRDLSLARAMAVLHALVDGSSIDDERCVVTGWGEYAPAAPNDTDANKARNRRVEIVVDRRSR
jgi:chemotaxis protein MotB